jgi:glycosyltransferase involved in cell wall biosynthesis
VVLGHGWRPPGLQSALAAHKQRDGIRIVQLIYDLTPVSHPHCYDPGLSEVFASYVSEACSSADGIITISECSKSDLQAFCRERLIPAPPIEVFRLGDDTHLGIDDPAGGIESLHGVPYILSVGSLQARKNHLLLYQAWKLALERGVTLPMLVIVGGTAFGAADTRYAIDNDPAVAGSIRILDHVADRELAWLYRHALFSVLPSVYEGWGLPVAESLAIGKICVASSAGSTPEIGGDLIEYFSPFSAAECLAAIERHLDPAFRREKEAAIRARYVVTSWDASSRQFAEALQRLVGA